MSGRENNGNGCPRLIEVALPIREISAECVREKNISHAHISRLHIWCRERTLNGDKWLTQNAVFRLHGDLWLIQR